MSHHTNKRVWPLWDQKCRLIATILWVSGKPRPWCPKLSMNIQKVTIWYYYSYYDSWHYNSGPPQTLLPITIKLSIRIQLLAYIPGRYSSARFKNMASQQLYQVGSESVASLQTPSAPQAQNVIQNVTLQDFLVNAAKSRFGRNIRVLQTLPRPP